MPKISLLETIMNAGLLMLLTMPKSEASQNLMWGEGEGDGIGERSLYKLTSLQEVKLGLYSGIVRNLCGACMLSGILMLIAYACNTTIR